MPGSGSIRQYVFHLGLPANDRHEQELKPVAPTLHHQVRRISPQPNAPSTSGSPGLVPVNIVGRLGTDQEVIDLTEDDPASIDLSQFKRETPEIKRESVTQNIEGQVRGFGIQGPSNGLDTDEYDDLNTLDRQLEGSRKRRLVRTYTAIETSIGS